MRFDKRIELFIIEDINNAANMEAPIRSGNAALITLLNAI